MLYLFDWLTQRLAGCRHCVAAKVESGSAFLPNNPVVAPLLCQQTGQLNL